MTVLLDTHTLLWALAEPDRLSARAADVIQTEDVVLVSAASAWEISTKHRLGRLPHASAIVAGYARHLERLRADELPISSAHAMLAGGLPVEHRDPFDRMLAAQALHEGVVLVTNDRVFATFEGVQTLW